MSEKNNKDHQNPFNYFLELATGSLLSSSSGNELKTDQKAGIKSSSLKVPNEKIGSSGQLTDEKVESPQTDQNSTP